MRNVWTLLILILFGAAGLYVLGGGSFEVPLEKDSRASRDSGRSVELNARGVQELADHQDERAVVTLREAAALRPGDPVITRNLSVALARSAMAEGRDEETALGMLKEALSLWPGNPEGLDGMTTIHFRNSRYDKALEYARKLQLVLPDRPDLNAYVEHLAQRAASVRGMVSEKGDRFRLLYSGKRKLEYEGEITGLLQVQMDALTAALGVFPENPVEVLILTEDLGHRADPMDPLMEGLYDGQIRLYMGDGIEDMEKFVLTVRHEIVHALLHECGGTLPGWVQEGLAQKVGEDPSEERIRVLKRYVRESILDGYDVNMNALDVTFIDMESEERSRAYATSLLFMDWLVENFGESFIQRFVSEISSGTGPFDAVESLTGMTFARVQEVFNRDLKGAL